MKIGALQRSMRRRRYADGGGVDPSDDDSIGMYSALSQSVPSDLMGRNGQPIEPPIPPDQQDGALSRSAAQPQQQSGDPDAAAKIARLQQARDVLASLQSGGGGGGGYSNLPLLAAAGAMLAPTRTGGFAESLSNAFSSGAATAEQQRQLQEQSALRRVQMEQNAISRQQMVDIAQQKADTLDRHQDTYDAVNTARAQQLQAAASLAMARAVGSLGGHATAGDNEAAAINDLVKQGYSPSDAWTAIHGGRWSIVGADPDGKPIMLDSKTGQTQVGTTALGIKPLDQAKIDARLKAIQQTADYRAQLVTLRQQGLDDFTAGNIMNNASRLMAADPTGKLTASEAVRQQLAGRSIAAPAAPSAPAPRPGVGSAPGATRPAPSGPTPGDIQDGYRYKGGPPGRQDSWEAVSP